MNANRKQALRRWTQGHEAALTQARLQTHGAARFGKAGLGRKSPKRLVPSGRSCQSGPDSGPAVSDRASPIRQARIAIIIYLYRRIISVIRSRNASFSFFISVRVSSQRPNSPWPALSTFLLSSACLSYIDLNSSFSANSFFKVS